MKRIFILLAALLLAAACQVKTVAPTGTSSAGPEWLFLKQGPVTLTTHVDTVGKMMLTLVTDRSLMADAPEIVLQKPVEIGPDSVLTVPLGRLEAGFYQVRLDSAIRFNIGVRPDEVVSPPDAPEDFDAFWASTLAEVATLPMDIEWTLLPERSNEIRQTFEIRYPSWGGAVSGGIVCVPVKEGKYPVHIQYIGYGSRQWYFDPSADPERIDFQVSVRDQGLFRDKEERWIDRGIDAKENFYYRGAFADVKRSVDIAASFEKADPDRMVAYGGSQGGAFTVVAAALDHRIKAIAPEVPFLGDYPDYGKIVWWPVHEVLETADAEGIPREKIYEMLRYFDVKNFAPKVECPAIMAFGLQDVTCPPHTNFAIYNNFSSAIKRFYCVPTCGHAMWNEAAWPPVRDAFLAEYIDSPLER